MGFLFMSSALWAGSGGLSMSLTRPICQKNGLGTFYMWLPVIQALLTDVYGWERYGTTVGQSLRNSGNFRN